MVTLIEVILSIGETKVQILPTAYHFYQSNFISPRFFTKLKL